jgi:hypothetical protein
MIGVGFNVEIHRRNSVPERQYSKPLGMEEKFLRVQVKPESKHFLPHNFRRNYHPQMYNYSR